MERRTYLQMGLVGFFVTSGCVTSNTDDETTTESSQDRNETGGDVVSVTMRQSARFHTKEITITDDGTLQYQLICEDRGDVERTVSLPTDAYQEFESLLDEEDVFTFAETYECTGSCPGGVPPKEFTFKGKETTRTVSVEAKADDVPATLAQISRQIDEFTADIDTPSCGET